MDYQKLAKEILANVGGEEKCALSGSLCYTTSLQIK